MTALNSPARELAQTLVDLMLAADPFLGTGLGLREYDALVPDPTAAAEDELSDALARIAAQAETVDADTLDDAVTLDVIRGTCERQRLWIATRASEFTVSAMPMAGPPALLAEIGRASCRERV